MIILIVVTQKSLLQHDIYLILISKENTCFRGGFMGVH